MGVHTQVNGLTTTCMVSAFTSGLMVETTKANTSRITGRVMGYSLGQTDGGTLAHGRRAKCTAKEHTRMLMDLKLKEFGLKASVL
jgi:hypothetical protein